MAIDREQAAPDGRTPEQGRVRSGIEGPGPARIDPLVAGAAVAASLGWER